jgi:hypothetical protein
MRRVVWLTILLIAVFGYVARAEMTVTTAPLDTANYTSTGADNAILSQNVGWIYRTQETMEMRNTAGTIRISLPFMRFDLSSVAGRHLNAATLQWMFGWTTSNVTRTFDVWGLIDGAGDMWDSNALSFTLASTPVEAAGFGWLTTYPDGNGFYGSYTMNSALWTRLGSVTFNVVDGGVALSNATALNMDAFFAADTNKLVTLTLTPFLNGNNWTSIRAYGNTAGSLIPTLTFPHAFALGASNPVPADEKLVTDMNMSQLSWNNYGIGKYELWFGPADANESNYDSLLVKVDTFYTTAPAQEVVTTNLPSSVLPLSAPGTYTWAVVGYQPLLSDPNNPASVYYTTEPNTVSAWQFHTINYPVVTQNPAEQHNFPLPAVETAVFTAKFECALPITSVKWYKEAGDTDIEMDAGKVTLSNDGYITYTTTLTLSSLTVGDDGSYYCVATSGGGSATSAQAKLVIKRQLAQYALDGDAVDSINGYNGTLFGTPNFAAGKTGQAMEFNVTTPADDYVGLPDAFATLTPGLTFSIWAKPMVAKNWARFIDLGNGPDQNNIFFARNATDNSVVFRVINGTATVCNVVSGAVITLNEWQHFVVTMNETGNVVIYRNGLSVATGTGTKPADATRPTGYFGKSNWATDEMYNGYMDDIRIYNYGFTADEANHLYADINGNYCRVTQTYDYNGDCKMNMADFAIFAAQWIDCGLWPACP